ncbi:PIG-L family deacetylase [Mycolicibacterium brumae]|uniref:PIG-L family deacetylase n=1 Tax=Mycolicibacterium brumae TaxID=85968 RepID=A0A2G5PCT2_9MYCO|nr:PIG-L family deacetylase [Mycolicibacterium brumae]RWA17250.1 hypothetical protein MBRU_06410 [Mycolicibacterium brumae DSM 44177]
MSIAEFPSDWSSALVLVAHPDDPEYGMAAAVDEVEFWGFPDSELFNTPELREKIAETIVRVNPDIVLSLYGGPEWGPGLPNQRDHIEFAAAVVEAFDELPDPPRGLFVNGPGSTHAVEVDDFTELAVDSLAEHDVYLSVLAPDTPVIDQARAQVDMTTGSIDGFPAARACGLTQIRPV